MAVIHLYRDVPEKGYNNTEMDCQEEFLEKFEKRGWKVKDAPKEKVVDTEKTSKRGKKSSAENKEDSVDIIGE